MSSIFASSHQSFSFNVRCFVGEVWAGDSDGLSLPDIRLSSSTSVKDPRRVTADSNVLDQAIEQAQATKNIDVVTLTLIRQRLVSCPADRVTISKEVASTVCGTKSGVVFSVWSIDIVSSYPVPNGYGDWEAIEVDPHDAAQVAPIHLRLLSGRHLKPSDRNRSSCLPLRPRQSVRIVSPPV